MASLLAIGVCAGEGCAHYIIIILIFHKINFEDCILKQTYYIVNQIWTIIMLKKLLISYVL